jgi:hypothetical protein
MYYLPTFQNCCKYYIIFSPPVNPPKEIEDPNDKKPEDWDEREK